MEEVYATMKSVTCLVQLCERPMRVNDRRYPWLWLRMDAT